jgi:AbrB family looped-hinge helix DNA binding protein
MATSTLTSKGQITVPKQIREKLKLKTGQKLDFQLGDNGQLVLRPQNRDVRLLKGIFKSPRTRRVTVKQMNDAIADGYAGG